MDLYITDSLQDMLDMDIKSEMATDLGSISDITVSIIIMGTSVSVLIVLEYHTPKMRSKL